jgi:hypothetical protein
MGFEPIPRFSRERILNPLRLPFRHIVRADRATDRRRSGELKRLQHFQNSSSSRVGARLNPYTVQNCFVDAVPFVLTSSHPQPPTPGHFAAKFRIAGPCSMRKNQES